MHLEMYCVFVEYQNRSETVDCDYESKLCCSAISFQQCQLHHRQGKHELSTIHKHIYIYIYIMPSYFLLLTSRLARSSYCRPQSITVWGGSVQRGRWRGGRHASYVTSGNDFVCLLCCCCCCQAFCK